MPARHALLAITSAFVAAAALLGSNVAWADWPDCAIKWVVPFGPGGANDLMARAAAEAVAKRLGQPVIIENKPGAGAIVGADFVAKAKPDGYTWLIAAAGVVTNSMLRADMPYADSDLVPVGMIAVAPSVIVVNPSVLANNVHATSEASIVVLPQVKAGKLKAVATTYSKRISAYDALPTAREQGFPGVLIGHWAGLFAPKGTPPAIVERMSKELEAAVKSTDFHNKMVPSGIEPEPGTTANFTAFLAAERNRLGQLAKKANMQADK
jgi:tripartite-type tricarboxylate transporter receptor subunit TctC